MPHILSLTEQECSADPPLSAALLKSVSDQLTCPFWFLFKKILSYK